MDSESVLLQFGDEVLPGRVMVGHTSFNVPPPIRFHNCQRYVHTASVCKGKLRCGRCWGAHGYGECDSSVTTCCDCEGLKDQIRTSIE